MSSVIVPGLIAALAGTAVAQEPVSGSLGIHDPSTMIRHGDRYWIFATGLNIASKWSTDKINWSQGPTVFSNTTRPPWTTAAVPGFSGTFWAPDIIYVNGQYRLYYSVSTFGSQVSAIGLVTNPTLDPGDPDYQWTDQGLVIQSSAAVNYNAIDPSVLLASDGRMWMAFGSFWTGIKMIELNPATGKRIAPNSTVYSLAARSGAIAIEAPSLIERNGFYYLFVNWDTCCSGLNSTYNIRVGRSLSVTGPYLDRNGVSMAAGGGSLVLESTGRYLGPGHAGIFTEADTNWFTYHYYDGNTANGSSRLALGRLFWTEDGWPAITNDWAAFYPFEADARDHRDVYSGDLENNASIVNDPDRGAVLNLDGTNGFVSLPSAVANASTFAVWVKWNGGPVWQRIFDFGFSSSRYLFLTPSNGENGRMRFAITISGSNNERRIDAPFALPVNSWCHVAVTLNGTIGKLFLNGDPVATNTSMTLRPWQVLARTNYLGDSQFAADPQFNGQLDSLRIFGRALSDDEVRELAHAHPALAHRYSFAVNATDSIGAAHGRMFGSAAVTNEALSLDGSPGSYVQLPGGLVSECSAVSVEFWAEFGSNGNWARVFDFGNSSGGSGQNFFFFSPHTGMNSHRFGTVTGSGIFDHDVPGTLDGRSVHVMCISDPGANYSAIYTNGVLESEFAGNVPPLSGVSSALSYLGRSLFAADAWLNARIDEFRIYHGRLTPQEIAANHAAGPDTLAIPAQVQITESTDTISFSWPSYAAGFELEQLPSLDPGAMGTPVDAESVITNGQYSLVIQRPETNAFYRLKR